MWCNNLWVVIKTTSRFLPRVSTPDDFLGEHAETIAFLRIDPNVFWFSVPWVFGRCLHHLPLSKLQRSQRHSRRQSKRRRRRFLSEGVLSDDVRVSLDAFAQGEKHSAAIPIYLPFCQVSPETAAQPAALMQENEAFYALMCMSWEEGRLFVEFVCLSNFWEPIPTVHIQLFAIRAGVFTSSPPAGCTGERERGSLREGICSTGVHVLGKGTPLYIL